VEELVLSETKDETANNSCAGSVRAPATFKSFVPTNVYGLLKTSSFKEGAM
jgi:hypothetical protein